MSWGFLIDWPADPISSTVSLTDTINQTPTDDAPASGANEMGTDLVWSSVVAQIDRNIWSESVLFVVK